MGVERFKDYSLQLSTETCPLPILLSQAPALKGFFFGGEGTKQIKLSPLLKGLGSRDEKGGVG